MKIAIVGGGIFGTTAAWKLAADGHRVTLFERNPVLLQGASGSNQFRLHRGYHYPRSVETVQECLQSTREFSDTYPESVVSENDHYYCISATDSRVSADDYLAFCERLGLPYEVVPDPPFMIPESLDLTIKVPENLYCADALRKTIYDKLARYGVNVVYQEAEAEKLYDYEMVVLATYSENNRLGKQLADADTVYQHELCEKILVELPEPYKRNSVVVMDGPFMCVDPYSTSGYHLLGNVVHAIHEAQDSAVPDFESRVARHANLGLVRNPEYSNFDSFIRSASEFFRYTDDYRYVGSFFTTRTVLANRDYDDARPTIVTRLNDLVVSVFSGKVNSCIKAADEICAMVRKAPSVKPATEPCPKNTARP
jgi:hypothetical protein